MSEQHPDTGLELSYDPWVKAVRQADGTIKVTIEWHDSLAEDSRDEDGASPGTERLDHDLQWWTVHHPELREFTIRPAKENAVSTEHAVKILTANGEVSTFTLPDEAAVTVEVNGREYVGITMPTPAEGDRPVSVTTFDADGNGNTSNPAGYSADTDTTEENQ